MQPRLRDGSRRGSCRRIAPHLADIQQAVAVRIADVECRARGHDGQRREIVGRQRRRSGVVAHRVQRQRPVAGIGQQVGPGDRGPDVQDDRLIRIVGVLGHRRIARVDGIDGLLDVDPGHCAKDVGRVVVLHRHVGAVVDRSDRRVIGIRTFADYSCGAVEPGLGSLEQVVVVGVARVVQLAAERDGHRRRHEVVARHTDRACIVQQRHGLERGVAGVRIAHRVGEQHGSASRQQDRRGRAVRVLGCRGGQRVGGIDGLDHLHARLGAEVIGEVGCGRRPRTDLVDHRHRGLVCVLPRTYRAGGTVQPHLADIDQVVAIEVADVERRARGQHRGRREIVRRRGRSGVVAQRRHRDSHVARVEQLVGPDHRAAHRQDRPGDEVGILVCRGCIRVQRIDGFLQPHLHHRRSLRAEVVHRVVVLDRNATHRARDRGDVLVRPNRRQVGARTGGRVAPHLAGVEQAVPVDIADVEA